jgi:hypothetical protein
MEPTIDSAYCSNLSMNYSVLLGEGMIIPTDITGILLDPSKLTKMGKTPARDQCPIDPGRIRHGGAERPLLAGSARWRARTEPAQTVLIPRLAFALPFVEPI